jgi:ABC-2 type transport system permease protein
MSSLERQRTTFVPDHNRLSFAGILRSESIKITSLHSTIGLVLAITGLGLCVSIVLALTIEGAGLPAAPSAGFMLDQVTVGTVLFGQLIAGVLGVMVISGEYSSGTIQTTLIAAPARVTVLVAKAIVLFVFSTAAALLAFFGSWAATYPTLATFGLEIGLSAPGVVLSFLGGAVYIGLAAVLGLGVGTLLRSVAASVSTVISLIILLPIVLSVLPASQLVRNLHLLTMSKAGDALSTVTDGGGGAFMDLADGYISPAAGLAITVVWAGVFMVLGAVKLRRQDA